MTVEVTSVFGRDIEPWLEALARLRIEVFREYPYLYEGDLAYEQRYLADYASSPEAVVVLAREGPTVVGAATAMPLGVHAEAAQRALTGAGYAPAQVYYLGESVLAASHRGQGLGHAFFDHREAAARQLGFRYAAFCAVDRGPAHPARPADYRALDGFWGKRGYVRKSDIVAEFAWRDVGEAQATTKPMVFWVREVA